jgi:ABC-type Fe3+/spermidine/putrescine transport system ATPase subunit
VNEYVAGLFGSYTLIPSSEANIFYEAWKTKPNKKNLLVRPEDFKIRNRRRNGIRGKVVDIRYFGSYYETEVLIGELSIIIRSKNRKSKKDETVYIYCQMKNVWWIA